MLTSVSLMTRPNTCFNSFQVYDDIDLMKRLGLVCGMEKDLITLENIEKIKSCVPEALRPDIDQIVNTNHRPFEAFKTPRQPSRQH
ncbi:hypothetical protein QR680_000396 [Steinernema hermaphroditum]|uniref:Transcription factor DP C-terminal domain-containing protein n=1 Tax=Steinernema hermaphroditum TaxID=289476 RepID=A0AA39GWF9_9BILA|nr:hypothetical protein QR680_000396 [Steinernema hermaphroditum]